MKIATSVWTGLALLAMAQTAQAAAPKVSGTYAVMGFTFCEARFTLPTTVKMFLRTIIFPSGQHTHSPTESGQHTHPTTSEQVFDRRIVQSPNGQGEVAISVGLITFTTTPAAGASTGSASVNESIVYGDVLRITVPHGVATKTETVAGTFSFTDTTFRFDPAGAPPAMIWTMRPGNFAAGAGSVARTLYMVRQEDAQCLNTITATKQLP